MEIAKENDATTSNTPKTTHTFSSATVSTTIKEANTPKNRRSIFWDQRILFLMLLPALLWLIVFKYLPMVGVYMAFTDYRPTNEPFLIALFKSDFVGLKWFKYFFSGGKFLRIMRNTLCTSLLSLLFTFPTPIFIAIIINEIRSHRFQKVVQTSSYLPNFISWVIVANMFTMILSANGPINELLVRSGLLQEPIIFLEQKNLFWLIIALLNNWKTMGYSSIMYLAAIAGIPQEQYESADIDGATRLQKIFHITLPGMKGTIVFVFIFAVSGILNAGFDQQILLGNSVVADVADVIGTHSYNYGLKIGNYTYGTAVGMFQSVVSFVLLVIANATAKKVAGQSLY